MKKALYRITDANYNRLKEGLRVCEDIIRYAFSDANLNKKYKKLRHQVTGAFKELPLEATKLLEARDSSQDVGKITPDFELTKKCIGDLFSANLQRSKEAARVLEESSKLISKKASLKFKDVRYKLYEIEKETFRRISSLRHCK